MRSYLISNKKVNKVDMIDEKIKIEVNEVNNDLFSISGHQDTSSLDQQRVSWTSPE
jgi:hypothetical protein